jgi:small-conductance mechanosensitive channel
VNRFNRHRLAPIVSLATLILLSIFCSIPTFAGEDDQESAPEQERQGYPVVVDGYEVFRIHQSLGAASAEERARRISARLEELVSARDFDPNEIKAYEEGGVTTVRYGDGLIVTLNDAAARGSGLSRQALAAQYIKLLQEKLTLAREQHTPRYLWRAATYTAITLLIYLLLLWLIIACTRWILRTVATSAKMRFKGIKIQQSEIVQGTRLTALLASGIRLLRAVVIAIVTYVALANAFSFFPWTREHGQRLLGYVVNPLIAMGEATLGYLPNLFYIFVIVVVLHFVLRILSVIAREAERGRIRIPGFYPEWVQPTYKIVRFLVYALGVVIVFPYLPFEKSPAFKGISVFLGVLFSLGSTSAVANLVAGIILIYTRGFRKGDWVTIGENTGEIVNQSMLATHLRTIRNEEITIPNAVVLGSHVTNFSLHADEQGVVLHTAVTIGYDASWRTIHKLLIDAALRTQNILHDPAPFVLQAELEDSYVKYEINAYTDHPLRMPFIYSDLHANIQDSFYEAGVEIMSPVFHALRDGNHVAMPGKYLSPDYKAKSFQVERVDDSPENTDHKG